MSAPVIQTYLPVIVATILFAVAGQDVSAPSSNFIKLQSSWHASRVWTRRTPNPANPRPQTVWTCAAICIRQLDVPCSGIRVPADGTYCDLLPASDSGQTTVSSIRQRRDGDSESKESVDQPMGNVGSTATRSTPTVPDGVTVYKRIRATGSEAAVTMSDSATTTGRRHGSLEILNNTKPTDADDDLKFSTSTVTTPIVEIITSDINSADTYVESEPETTKVEAATSTNEPPTTILTTTPPTSTLTNTPETLTTIPTSTTTQSTAAAITTPTTTVTTQTTTIPSSAVTSTTEDTTTTASIITIPTTITTEVPTTTTTTTTIPTTTTTTDIPTTTTTATIPTTTTTTDIPTTTTTTTIPTTTTTDIPTTTTTVILTTSSTTTTPATTSTTTTPIPTTITTPTTTTPSTTTPTTTPATTSTPTTHTSTTTPPPTTVPFSWPTPYFGLPDNQFSSNTGQFNLPTMDHNNPFDPQQQQTASQAPATTTTQQQTTTTTTQKPTSTTTQKPSTTTTTQKQTTTTPSTDPCAGYSCAMTGNSTNPWLCVPPFTGSGPLCLLCTAVTATYTSASKVCSNVDSKVTMLTVGSGSSSYFKTMYNYTNRCAQATAPYFWLSSSTSSSGSDSPEHITSLACSTVTRLGVVQQAQSTNSLGVLCTSSASDD